MVEKKQLVLQEWEESEAGWGVRPDGYSFHLSEDDCKAYIKEYWDGMPKKVQHEYSRTSGNLIWVVVSAAFYKKSKEILGKDKKGYRVWHSDGQVVTSKTGERTWEEKVTYR